MELKDRLKYARERRDWTQAELARWCRVSPQAISDLEAGKSGAMKSNTLLRSAAGLRVRVDWLAHGHGDMEDIEALRHASVRSAGNPQRATTTGVTTAQAELLALLRINERAYLLAQQLLELPAERFSALLMLADLDSRAVGNRRIRAETVAVERRHGERRRIATANFEQRRVDNPMQKRKEK